MIKKKKIVKKILKFQEELKLKQTMKKMMMKMKKIKAIAMMTVIKMAKEGEEDQENLILAKREEGNQR